VEHTDADPLRQRFPRVLITGSGGQLGTALVEVFPWANARTKQELDLRVIGDLRGAVGDVDLALHAGAWTHVDLAQQDSRGVALVNVLGTQRVAALGAPVVYYSTDYVFDGRQQTPYVESDTPHPLNVYGQTKLGGEKEIHEGWVVRSSWLFGWTGDNFVRTMLRLGAEREEVAVVDDQRGSPTFVGHLAEATRDLVQLPFGLYHVAAAGDCTWADFAEAIFAEASLPCRVRRMESDELARPAPRPAYSVLRSEKPEAPRLPHWREGLRACLARLGLVRS
jgi:dTDP-4-dehydrorhamnose reductase